ncbi:hypothetical protein K2173_007417 [Erythroxylum novogranatense]|uniref:Protein kinase domain-containing protein n=1 Tax=Erythroxylum novogranatense TaxID=1862640 RepID=A0AAV8T656_9ROSI|nr:hypothetical protein K2173_007417 [Erythroxylum novogranatense]
MEKKRKRIKQVLFRILTSNRCEECLHYNVVGQDPEQADNSVSVLKTRNSGFKVNPKQGLRSDKRCSCIRSSNASISNKFQSSVRDYLRVDEEDKTKPRTRSFSAVPETVLGWPLLGRNYRNQEALSRAKARSMSVVEWVMSLTSQSSPFDFTTNRTSSLFEGETSRDSFAEDFGIKETSFYEIHESENETTNVTSIGKVEKSALHQDLPSSCSVTSKESGQPKLGWPLLVLKNSVNLGELSVVNPIDHLRPASPKPHINLASEEAEDSSEDMISYCEEKMELVLKLKSSGSKLFSYEELNKATRQFSSENLIGEGGCSNVYKGLLSGGKLIAVKILKHYKEAFKDLSLEIEVMSLLNHRNITPLVGACIKDDHLILVYDFLPKGSLEENLHASFKESVLPWKVRYQLALAIAEALNYLHNECPRSVIHRDVKSSNILLSHDFQPQLSDFGLALWGPQDSDYMMVSDLVGTFGYLAPEYVMHGRVSNKVDVYAFGVVLLELLTGQKPISAEGLKGQQSLVKWATPLLEKGDLNALLDPRLEKDFNIVQMNKMIVAATLCTRQSARLRPKVSQVLKLLNGIKDGESWFNSYVSDSSKDDFDGFATETDHKPSFDVFLNDYTRSLCGIESKSAQGCVSNHRLTLKDYLQKPQV